MKLTDAPKKQPVPFASNGQREDILATTPAGDNTASYDAGFPPVTMILKAAGGRPPKGQDMNQILFELSNLSRWFSAGALNIYDSSFSSAIGGYPKGAVLLNNSASGIFISNVDGNTNDPNSISTGWIDLLSFLGGASLNGSSSQIFRVAQSTTDTNAAVPLGQLTFNVNNLNNSISTKANLSGSSSQQFSVADATSNSQAASLGQLNTGLGTKVNSSQFTTGSTSNGTFYSLPNGLQVCRFNMAVRATGADTWTFPASFLSAPQVFLTVVAPSSDASKNLWINGISSTTVSIYNPNSILVNLNLLAIL